MPSSLWELVPSRARVPRESSLGAWDPIPLKVDRREQLRTFFDLDAVGNDMGDAASAGVSAAAPVVSDAAQAGANAAMSGAQAAAPMVKDAASSAASAVMSGAQAAAPMVGDAASSLASNLGDAASNLGDDNGCFPAASCVLERRRGVVRMEDVRVGDELDCGGVFSPVIAMLHRSPGEMMSYVVIHFVSGAVVISRNHLIQLQEETEEGPPRFCWVPAADVRVGQQLQNGQRVISVTSAEATGLFAPLTLSSTLLVDGALCSCFAPPLELGLSHELCHRAMAPLRAWHQAKSTLESTTTPRWLGCPLWTLEAWTPWTTSVSPTIHPYAASLLLTLRSLHRVLNAISM
ncbi:unnamed protein product [Durusdinium trenchii]|uniref:Desert hedgehog protein B (Desert hedgehog protein 2) (DHH-2) (Hedgehog protein 4) (X-HH4) [Cleaved into: Desert hedgehog protein B N-product n=2 Tax=Durusdinium trenchii TaxID=1381693 RepID=A0ABP0MR67_9DINO